MKTDILVVGSGIAGLSFAIKAKKYADITIVTKGKINESNTEKAQGGLAAVFDKSDNFRLHIKDTLRAGDGLCNKKAVELLVKNVPKEILWLEKIGVKFDKKNSNFSSSKEAAHSRSRIVHAGDITGNEIEKILVKNIKKSKIKFYENNIAYELITNKGKCIGAKILDIKNNKAYSIFSKITVLATGGAGQIYQHTCNPEIATADGLALAYNAGADLQDLEFVQFHPTGLYHSKPTFLISETLRGEGGHLKNKFGEIYMPKYHRDGELAPRDVVSKFSVNEMERTKSKYVYLDVSHLDSDYLKKRFPNIYKECLKYDIDLTKQQIPVTPTAHYMCGGVKADLNTKTSIKNLYAIGEVSCTGLHGADRLASNSLTEGLVFGTILSDKIKNSVKNIKIDKIINKKNIILKNKKINKFKKRLQKIMWDKVGIIRTKKSLNSALNGLNRLEKQTIGIKGINKEIIELRNMLTVSKLITKSALARKESRGTHFIQDFPTRNDKIWMKHSIINRKGIRFII